MSRLSIRPLILASFFLVALPEAVRGAGPGLAIVVGGGCEKQNKDNDFHGVMVDMAGALTRQGWQVAPLNDGDIANCTLRADDPLCQTSPKDPGCCPVPNDPKNWSNVPIAKAAGAPVQSATADNFFAALQDARKLPAGSQLLITFSAHGSRADGTQSHGICFQDCDCVPMNDPRLVKALTALKEKSKLKLAFSDSSCYSGGSVTALGQFGCVISAQSANRQADRLGTSHGIADLLNAAPATGGSVTMGDAFLATLFNENIHGSTAKAQYHSMGQPEISGFATTGYQLEGYLKPPDSTEVKGDLEQLHAYCTTGDPMKSLAAQIDQLKALGNMALTSEDKATLTAIGWPGKKYASEAVPLPDPKDVSARLSTELAAIQKLTAQYQANADQEQKINQAAASAADAAPLTAPLEAQMADQQTQLDALKTSLTHDMTFARAYAYLDQRRRNAANPSDCDQFQLAGSGAK